MTASWSISIQISSTNAIKCSPYAAPEKISIKNILLIEAIIITRCD